MLRTFFWLVGYRNQIRKFEIKSTVWCFFLENFCRCTLQGSVVYGVVGHYGHVYILVPLQLVGANFILNNSLQLLVTALHQAYCLCVFNCCVFKAKFSLYHRPFHYFGSKSCAFFRQYGNRYVRLSCENMSTAWRMYV